MSIYKTLNNYQIKILLTIVLQELNKDVGHVIVCCAQTTNRDMKTFKRNLIVLVIINKLYLISRQVIKLNIELIYVYIKVMLENKIKTQRAIAIIFYNGNDQHHSTETK